MVPFLNNSENCVHIFATARAIKILKSWTFSLFSLVLILRKSSGAKMRKKNGHLKSNCPRILFNSLFLPNS